MFFTTDLTNVLIFRNSLPEFDPDSFRGRWIPSPRPSWSPPWSSTRPANSCACSCRWPTPYRWPSCAQCRAASCSSWPGCRATRAAIFWTPPPNDDSQARCRRCTWAPAPNPCLLDTDWSNPGGPRRVLPRTTPPQTLPNR